MSRTGGAGKDGRLRVFLYALMTWLAVLPLGASAQAVGERHVAMTLVPESPAPAPGRRVTIAFSATPAPGWHAYWKNGGDAGIETQLDWTLPAGVSAGPIAYPVPGRLLISGLMNYVYEKPFAMLVDLAIPAGLAPGTRLPVRVKADYLVCTEEICVPESAVLTAELTVGDGAANPAAVARFDGWRRALPRPLGYRATFAVADKRFRLAVPYPASAAASDAYFYPLQPGAIDFAAPQRATRDGDTLTIETAAAPIGSLPARLEGVLATGGGRGFAIVAMPGTIAASEPPAAEWSLALLAFLGAVAGGVLLNVMPCVFPILSLKALSLAKANAGEAAARRDALAYAAGVILVCLALGGLLLALRAGGATVGWAFQLQDPRVILTLLLVIVGIALNLAGLFELPTPAFAGRGGAAGAFATGALAAFVATPCTGPFMGSALFAALVLPAAAALLVFAGLGLGIALPFLAIGFVPALRRRLPKPGGWMVTFRHILSVPMFATALALAWVLGRQAGVDGLTLGLAAAVVAGLASWWVGARQSRGRSAAWWPALPALALAVAAVAIVRPAASQPAVAIAGAEPFSEARLAALRAEGRPVFAYFTADWCVTCKINEKAVIETAAVTEAFGKANVAVLVGDWTGGDPALGRFIESHNRAGVPLYLWYAKDAARPRVLPQILTKGMITALPGG